MIRRLFLGKKSKNTNYNRLQYRHKNKLKQFKKKVEIQAKTS